MKTLLDVLVPAFFLSVGVPCLLAPRHMQRFVLSFNARFGHIEAPDGFRRSSKYLGRLRLIGILMVLFGLFAAFDKQITHLVI